MQRISGCVASLPCHLVSRKHKCCEIVFEAINGVVHDVTSLFLLYKHLSTKFLLMDMLFLIAVVC